MIKSDEEKEREKIVKGEKEREEARDKLRKRGR